jgi:Spondin_N.
VLAGLGAGAVGLATVPAATQASGHGTAYEFTVTVENVSQATTLQTTADGESSEQGVPLSPGAYAVHSPDQPIFATGRPERDNGLEEVAEDGTPGRLAESLGGRDSVFDAGAFNTPVGADGAGPLPPGQSYEFTVEALSGAPEMSLSFVTMFIPSNDGFYALGGQNGFSLFDGDTPKTGDVTNVVGLWDAGTEVNQEPGVGNHQAQRQRGAGVGDVEREVVVPMARVNGYDYPNTSDVVEVSLSAEAVSDQ